METLKKCATSMVAIIAAFIIFFPIAFVLLYYRFLLNGGKLRAGGNMCWICAIFCYMMAASGISVTFEDSTENYDITIVLIIAFLLSAVILTVSAIMQKRKYKHYKKYLTYMVARRKIKIEELAHIMQEKEENVIQNVSEMIQTKMIDGYINEHKEFISAIAEDSHKEVIKNIQVVAVECEGCGATNNYIIGKENRCEYCNSCLKNIK